MSTTSRRSGTTPKKAHKVEVSFSNWMMGGSLLALSTTSSLGSRVSSKGSRKSFDMETDEEEPPDPAPPATKKPSKKKEIPATEPKKPEEKTACADCGPEPQKPTKCAPNCPICTEECAWEKHMIEKYGFMECDACGRGSTWLKDEFHLGRGEYACEKCTPDCATCGRGPLWLSKKWQKTLKRRAKKLQAVDKDKKKDGDGKKDKGDDSTKKTKDGDGEKTKGKGKGDEKDKEKENTGDKSSQKDKDSNVNKEAGGKNDQGGKGKKGGHEWTSEQDAKLKELKAQNKSWRDIGMEVGVNVGLCKARLKEMESTNETTPPKKDKISSGDKETTGGGDEVEGLLGGFGDWDNEVSNQKTDNPTGSGDNSGWGATNNTLNTNEAANDSWANGNDNNTSNTTADGNTGANATSSWGNNDSSNDATASSGDQAASGWDTSNGTSGDTGNGGWGESSNTNANDTVKSGSGISGWDNGNSSKTANDSSKTGDNQQNKDKQKSGGKNENNDKAPYGNIIGEITASNPTGYIPYKSKFTTGGGGTSSWEQSGNTTSTDTNAAQASGGSPKTVNADTSGWGVANDSWNSGADTSNNNTDNVATSGSSWGVPKTDWGTTNNEGENAGNEPKRDPWIQPPIESDGAGATDSGNNPAMTDNNGWFTVTDSNLDFPSNSNAGANWIEPEVLNRTTGNGSHSGDQDATGNGNADSSRNKSETTYQPCGNGRFSWGQGGDNSNNNDTGNSSYMPNAWNSSHNPKFNAFNQGQNGGGFNSGSFNSGGFHQGGSGGGFNNPNTFSSGGFDPGKQSRGKLQPTGMWSQADCTFLEFLEAKYRDHKWVQMQADFFNWSKRMVNAEMIERKFRDDGYSL